MMVVFRSAAVGVAVGSRMLISEIFGSPASVNITIRCPLTWMCDSFQVFFTPAISAYAARLPRSRSSQ